MINSTMSLVNTIKKMYPVVTFFKDRYFPDGQNYYSEKALIEVKKKGRKIAPFVVPVVNGIVMERDGYKTEEIDAPYIAPKMAITPKMLEQKAFGENPYSGRTPAERENEIQLENIDDMRNSVYRSMEKMCTDIILTGQTIMKHYATAENAAKGINYDERVLRFYEGSFGNKYSFSKKFKTMTAKEKLDALWDMAAVLRKRGVAVTDLVMTSDVSKTLMTDEEFLKYYDKARVDLGSLAPAELPSGVVCNGGVNINGVKFVWFTYDNQYEDLDGQIKEFLPAGTIAMLHPGLGRTDYAQVTFVENGHFKSYAEKIIPHTLVDEKDNVIETGVFSRPVPYPLDVEGWLVADADETPSGNSSESSSSEGGSSGSGDTGNDVTLKTSEEINAMTTKAPLIAYAESIGLTTLTDASTVAELKEAILAYQEETYGADSLE